MGRRLDEARRSDLPRLFRAAHLDDGFPSEGLVGSFRRTLAGLGIDLDSQENVLLDTESRPSKSPRAFCATPRVPEEIHLVVPPIGGREDYSALFHEGGHAEHYGCTDALPARSSTATSGTTGSPSPSRSCSRGSPPTGTG